MILQQIFAFIVIHYREILLCWAQELYLAEALAHAPNHLLIRLKDLLDLAPIEKACASYRHESGAGCPPKYPISLLVRAIVVGWLYGLSLRQLEERMHYDLLVGWFIGRQAGSPIPDHTTLGRFELWLAHTQPDLFFNTVLNQIDQYFPGECRQVQVGDTYAMLANVADEGLVGRIRHVCLRLTVELQASFPNQFERFLQGFDWQALYGPKPEKPRALLSKEARAQRLESTVLAVLDFQRRVDQLLAPYPSQSYGILRSWLSFLDKVLNDEVCIQRDAQQAPQHVSELPHNKKGSFRIMGANDPQATLRKHGSDAKDTVIGYNIQVAATVTGFIRETQAYTGADPDQSGVAPLISAQKQRQLAAGQPLHLPPKLIYDLAAGAGKTRAEVEKASDGQTQLVSKLPPPANGSPLFNPYDFTLSEDGLSLTCPNGKVSRSTCHSSSGDGRVFDFFHYQCAPDKLCCPLWEQCRKKGSSLLSQRQVFISDYRRYVLEAESFNRTEEFRQDIHQRPLIERLIFELTHYCSARHCRRRGLAAADFQAKCCAAVYNLKLWARKLTRTNVKRSIHPLAG